LTPDLCVWLGTEEDREVCYSATEEAHRCYARRPPWAMDLAHQAWYCLTDQHRVCKYYREPFRTPAPPAPGPMVTVEDEVGPLPVAPPWPRAVLWVASLLMAAIVIYIIAAEILSAVPAPTLASAIGIDLSPSPSPVSTLGPMATALATSTPAPAFAFLEPTGTPTPYPGGAIYDLSPHAGAVGWVASDEDRGNHLGDSFLHTGVFDGIIYHGIFQVDLSPVPGGGTIHSGVLELTGLEDRRLGTAGVWEVRVLAGESEAGWSRQTYQDVHNAAIRWTLSPVLSADELLVGHANTFVLPEGMIRNLEQRLMDEQYLISFRIDGPLVGENSLYAWDSGFGPLSLGDGPRLVLNVGPAPDTPAPTFMPEGLVPTSTPPPADATSGTATLAP